MRSQLNELSKIAKDLKDLLADHHGIINSPIEVSENMRGTTVNVDYMIVSFNRFPSKLEVKMYHTDKFNETNVIIDIDRISDEDLDAILLRSKEEIVAFKRLFEQQVVAKRRMKILELQAELEKLSDDERAI